VEERDVRAVVSAACWYAKHLGVTAPQAKLVFITDDARYKLQLQLAPALPQLAVFSLSEYLKQYHSKQTEMHDLYGKGIV
jgi:hypothetical protein